MPGTETQTQTQTPEQVAAAAAEAARVEAEAEGKKVYDAAYVKSLRDEAKKHRLEKEAEAEARAALQKQIDDEAKAKLAEEKKWKELFDREKSERETERASLTEKLTAADRRLILAEAKTMAVAAGIIDVGDVASGVDLKDLRIDDNGNVPGLQEQIDALKTAKPHWFKSGTTTTQTTSRTVATPPRADGTPPGKDWNTATKAEVAAELKRLGVN